ncbi:uncharacterized protein LOC131887930 isoform X2 [Tigriopus californicus]|uniref:uncharacterized protein LOC131887930 isoform X2 n=1 Tax=Tigriopus californicus TaxID=6832 RepID=UPI0027DA7FDC|nr:uncharacterized protein LOC131887930 isoform X2 [Tigriopus californicus]
MSASVPGHRGGAPIVNHGSVGLARRARPLHPPSPSSISGSHSGTPFLDQNLRITVKGGQGVERVIEYAEPTLSSVSSSPPVPVPAPAPISSEKRSIDSKNGTTPNLSLESGLNEVVGRLAQLGQLRWQEKAQVRLTHFENWAEFWVMRAEAQDLLGRLINEPLAAALAPVQDPPFPGMKFIIRSPTHGLVRVEIEAVKKKGIIEVSLMDVGVVEMIKVEALLVMPPLLLEVPALAVHCKYVKTKEVPQVKQLDQTHFTIECQGWNEEGDVMVVDIPDIIQLYSSKDSFKPVPAFEVESSDLEYEDAVEEVKNSQDEPIGIPSQDSSFSQIPRSFDADPVAPLKSGKDKKLSGKRPFAIPTIPPLPIRSSPEMLSAGTLRRNIDSFVIPETVSPFDPTQCIPSDEFVVVHVIDVQAFDSILVTYQNNEIEVNIQGLHVGHGYNPSDDEWNCRAVQCLKNLLLDQDVVGNLMVKRTAHNSFGVAFQKLEVECQLFDENVASMLNELGDGLFSLAEVTNAFHIHDLPPLEDFNTIKDSVFKFSCITNAIFVKLKKHEETLKKMESLIAKVDRKPIEKSSLSEGLLVLAEYEYSLYRACVKHWDDDDIVQVLFIDHGNEKSYCVGDLYVLPEQFMDYAQFCHLVQLKWVERKEMTDMEMVRSLKLLNGTDGDLKLALSHITKDGMPVVTPRSKANRYLMADFKNIVLDVGLSIHNRAEDLGCPSAKGVIQGVIIRVCEEDPSVFYLVPDENLELGIEINRRLAKFYASHSRPDLYVPSESEVLAYRDEGNNFYRVIAKNVDEESVTCYFIDYGLEEEVEPCDLFPLITNVEDYAQLALICRVVETSVLKQIARSQRYLVEVVEKDCNHVRVNVLEHVP